MKKTIMLAILSAAVLGLAGCGETASTAESSDAAETTTAETTDTTAETETTAEETTTSEAASTTIEETTADETTTAAVSDTTTTAAAETTAAPAADTGWKDAYKAIVTEFKGIAENPADAYWDLQDLDQDGTPELIIAEGTAHVSGARLYYYEDGAAKQMIQDDGQPLIYGEYGEFLVCPEEHLAAISNTHMGFTYTDIRKYENHKLTKILFMDDNENAPGEETIEYKVNDVKVTKEEYEAKFKSDFESRNWTKVGTKYSIDDLSALN